ncbi:MAG: energy-coupling factor ABC transporter permease [Candidatus Promineifilaceae bacterium]|nr:energy-coupling factor ABC transporter permease [Candidatus Promineifilaceae bacterium]
MSSFISTFLLLHIPDGFLSFAVAFIAWMIILGFLIVALRKGQQALDDRLIPLAGIMGAFIFAAQMINFPVAGGTSGHFIGAALAFIVLGPWLGLLTMTAVIALQALLFQDGGLLVMGANILIMGVIPGFIGYQVYRMGSRRSPRVRLALGGIAAWLAIMGAALATTLLLALSGTTTLALTLSAMLGVHTIIGIGEALITVAALALIGRSRPTLLEAGADHGGKTWLVTGLIITLLLVMIAPFASGHPDGLEWVAETTGFTDMAQESRYQLLPDYTLPWLGETPVSTILAGIIGILVVFVIIYSISKALGRQKRLKNTGITGME